MQYKRNKMSNVDYEFKIVIVGRWGVGKSAFMTRYCDKEFKSLAIATVGIDFRYKTLQRQDKIVKLKIWDTMGGERFNSITDSYLRGAKGVILMFDLTEEESAIDIAKWVSKIRELAWENAGAVLVGNKSDLTEKRKITKERGLGMAQFLEVKYFESSTKDNVNVDEAFDSLVDSILEKMGELTIQPTQGTVACAIAGGFHLHGIGLNRIPTSWSEQGNENNNSKCLYYC